MAKIMITEDDVQIRTAYEFEFTRAGHEVIIAADGNEALRLLETQHPNIILLDMLMPGISGLDFLRQSGVSHRYPEITVIAFSNIDTPRVVEEAKTLGVADYLLKVEITPSEMLKIINTYLATK